MLFKDIYHHKATFFQYKQYEYYISLGNIVLIILKYKIL